MPIMETCREHKASSDHIVVSPRLLICPECHVVIANKMMDLACELGREKALNDMLEGKLRRLVRDCLSTNFNAQHDSYTMAQDLLNKISLAPGAKS